MGAVQSVVNQAAFPRPPRAFSETELLMRPDLVFLKTSRGQQVPAIYRRLGGAKMHSARFTVVYSHGNAEDVGLSLPYIDFMSNALGVDVLAYEYVGYSIADGEPSENGVYESAEAAWAYLRTCQVPPASIVLFGRSLGSAPAVHLAALHADVGGCILLSPLASGLRVLSGVTTSILLKPFDPFQNYAKVNRIMCPSVVMHGTEDEVRARAATFGTLHPQLALRCGISPPPSHPSPACRQRAAASAFEYPASSRLTLPTIASLCPAPAH